MNWTNIKKWAKDKGYKVSREKSVDKNNPYNYEKYSKGKIYSSVP